MRGKDYSIRHITFTVHVQIYQRDVMTFKCVACSTEEPSHCHRARCACCRHERGMKTEKNMIVRVRPGRRQE